MTLAALCEATMTLSDNTAGNLVLKAIGGPAGFTAFARALGDPVTRLDRWEPGLNEARPGDPRDTTSPDAMAANLQRLALGDALSPRSRDRLVAWLVANTTGDARLRAGAPKGLARRRQDRDRPQRHRQRRRRDLAPRSQAPRGQRLHDGDERPLPATATPPSPRLRAP
jgi:beta-lactamase class A